MYSGKIDTFIFSGVLDAYLFFDKTEFFLQELNEFSEQFPWSKEIKFNIAKVILFHRVNSQAFEE